MAFRRSYRKIASPRKQAKESAAAAACDLGYLGRVNLLGHALLASMVRPEPDFVLGAVLPDLSSMLGVSPEVTSDGPLGEGIAFHHESDACFHDLPEFIQLCRSARESLSDLRRGPKLAAAHVMVEFLLDGIWARRFGHQHLHAALARGPRHPALHFAPDHSLAFARACARLCAEPLHLHYTLPDTLARRLTATLHRRPALRLSPQEQLRLAPAISALRPAVVEAAPVILDRLQRDLLPCTRNPPLRQRHFVTLAQAPGQPLDRISSFQEGYGPPLHPDRRR